MFTYLFHPKIFLRKSFTTYLLQKSLYTKVCVHGFYQFFFFFKDTAPTNIYSLSLHDALPISTTAPSACLASFPVSKVSSRPPIVTLTSRSEEHTSELQSRPHLVCRLLLE